MKSLIKEIVLTGNKDTLQLSDIAENMISLTHEFKAITELTIISFDYISFKCFKDDGSYFSIADAMSLADIMFVKNAHLTEIVASEKSIYITSNTI